MNRQFSIRVDPVGTYAVNERTHGMIYQFSNIIDALAYVRRQCAGENARVRYYDARGQRAFTIGS